MKKLYKKGKIHPSPPLISDHLAFLPISILALTSALCPEDREVLAYLISCSGTPDKFSGAKKKTHKNNGSGGVGGGGAEHPPLFHCNCFQCYTSYWVRWDASPNRKLIHDIIDAFEDELTQKKKKMKKKNKKERKKKECDGSDDLKRFEESSEREEMGVLESVEVSDGGSGNGDGDGDEVGSDGEEEEEEEELEKGAVTRLVGFLGEKIWGVLSR